MSRQLVSRDELHQILNERLHAQDPCGECHFGKAPIPLRAPDKTCCNWSQDLIWGHGRHKSDACEAAVARTITEVASEFNLH
jgi:hypothetical protein